MGKHKARISSIYHTVVAIPWRKMSAVTDCVSDQYTTVYTDASRRRYSHRRAIKRQGIVLKSNQDSFMKSKVYHYNGGQCRDYLVLS